MRKKCKLSEICDVRDGTHDSPEYVLKGFPLVTSKNIVDGNLDLSVVNYISEEDYNHINLRSKVNSGDIIMPMIGTIGNPLLVEKYTAFAIKNVALIKFPNPNTLNKYIYHFLKSDSFKSYVLENNRGGTQKFLSLKDIRNMEIPLISFEEQLKICSVLDKVDELIFCRKEQIAKLDELVKARFVEMFGDPIKNTQNRPTTEFINVVKMQRGFDLPVQDRQQDGDIPVFGSNGDLDRHNVAKVQGGGVITGRSGTIGKVYYTEGDYWPLNTSLFSVDTHGNSIIYLAYLLQMYDLSRFTEGTGVPTLNRNKFHNKPIIDIPLKEQEQFAVFVKQTNKTKAKVQKSLDELEILKKSLMQKYFG